MLQLRAQPEYRRTRPLYPGFLGVSSQAKIPINGSIILLISPLFLGCATEGSSIASHPLTRTRQARPQCQKKSPTVAERDSSQIGACRARISRPAAPSAASLVGEGAECAFTAAPAMW